METQLDQLKKGIEEVNKKRKFSQFNQYERYSKLNNQVWEGYQRNMALELEVAKIET